MTDEVIKFPTEWMSQAKLAKLLGVSRQRLHQVCDTNNCTYSEGVFIEKDSGPGWQRYRAIYDKKRFEELSPSPGRPKEEPSPNMTIKRLKKLLEIAETNGLTYAAESINVSPSVLKRWFKESGLKTDNFKPGRKASEL